MKGTIAPHLLILPKCPSGLSLDSSEELNEEINPKDSEVIDEKYEVKEKFRLNIESQLNERKKKDELREV